MFIAMHVGIQLLACVGIFFVFGFILSKIQTTINNQYRRVFGWKGILWTAWIGTPIHELSHAIVAWLFHHTIHHISLFSPNEETGGLGHVDHSFQRFSVWQRMGNFFIGAAPMITGPIVLTTLLYMLMPHAKEIFFPLASTVPTISSIAEGFVGSLNILFSSVEFDRWQFWLFLYLSFCVSCHMAPSKADLKGMLGGFVSVVGLLIIANITAHFLGILLSSYLPMVYRYLHIFTSLYLYATLLSVIHLICTSTVFSLFGRGLYVAGKN